MQSRFTQDFKRKVEVNIQLDHCCCSFKISCSLDFMASSILGKNKCKVVSVNLYLNSNQLLKFVLFNIFVCRMLYAFTSSFSGK